DFIGRCGELVLDDQGQRLDRVAYDEAHRVFVAQMNPKQLREAIEKPAVQVGLRLEGGLPSQILDDVRNEPGALPLVEHALELLWQNRRGRWLTQAAYEALGSAPGEGGKDSGVVGALRKHADDTYKKLREEEQPIARHLLLSLV